MRYTRTKQLIRLTGGKYWEYTPNVRIDEMCKLLSDYELDKSFKWHREEGCISFSEDIFGRTFVTEVTIHKKEPMMFF